MAKSRVAIDIPDAILGEAKEKELKKLRKENTKLLNQVRDQEIKLRKLEYEKKQIQEHEKTYQELREYLAHSFDLYTEQYPDDGGYY